MTTDTITIHRLFQAITRTPWIVANVRDEGTTTTFLDAARIEADRLGLKIVAMNLIATTGPVEFPESSDDRTIVVAHSLMGADERQQKALSRLVMSAKDDPRRPALVIHGGMWGIDHVAAHRIASYRVDTSVKDAPED